MTGARAALPGPWNTRRPGRSRGFGPDGRAARLRIPEQTVANLKFQAKKRLQDHLKAADLSPDVFPELTAAG